MPIAQLSNETLTRKLYIIFKKSLSCPRSLLYFCVLQICNSSSYSSFSSGNTTPLISKNCQQLSLFNPNSVKPPATRIGFFPIANRVLVRPYLTGCLYSYMSALIAGIANSDSRAKLATRFPPPQVRQLVCLAVMRFFQQ